MQLAQAPAGAAHGRAAAPPSAAARLQPPRTRTRCAAARRSAAALRGGAVPPCVLYEDEHLLVVHKPAGWNTHAPAPHAGEGVYDWLRAREPRWASLSIIHRLDKETSGVLVFGLTPAANKSLSSQFEQRAVTKTYRLHTPLARRAGKGGRAGALAAPPAGGALAVTVRDAPDGWLRVSSGLARQGERYAVCAPAADGSGEAVTLFRELSHDGGASTLLEARPVTGRTHQIRVHAAALGAPVLGDALYGGAPDTRVWLHAASIALRHPADGRQLQFEAAADEPGSVQGSRWSIARAVVDADETDIFRLRHGSGGTGARTYVDCLGDVALVQSEGDAPPDAAALLGVRGQQALCGPFAAAVTHARTRFPPAQTAPLGARGRTIARVYHKRLRRAVRTASEPADTSPRLVAGAPGAERFVVRENGALYELSMADGYSVGLFHDQRDNRRRLLTGHVAPGFGALWPPSAPGGARPELLNVFAYTCAFSVAAALAGARTTSLDVSKKYLAWGSSVNFPLNGLDAEQHDFIYGDAFDWLRRLARKGRAYDAVLLDPPTFSTTRAGRFSAERDYGTLVAAALAVLRPGGALLCSTNAARLAPAAFLEEARGAMAAAGRAVLAEHYAPQPPDFVVSREEPAYLKTVWLRVG
jgi:23S rRNA (cytosine1962-C5)-methyltransferase